MMFATNLAHKIEFTTYRSNKRELDEQILNLYLVSNESANSPVRYDELGTPVNATFHVKQNLDKRTIDLKQLANTLNAKEMSSIALMYPTASRRLEMFRVMRLNWDIKEDIPATDNTIDLAYKTLSQLRNMAEQSSSELPEPYVYLLSDGQIEFEWELNGREFDLGIVQEDSFAVFSSLAQPSADPDTWIDDEDRVLLDEIDKIPIIQTFLSWL